MVNQSRILYGIILSVFILIFTQTLFEVYATQYIRYSIEEYVEIHPIVLIGTVDSVSMVIEDHSKTIEPVWLNENGTIVYGTSYYREQFELRQKVTVTVDQYLKDSTNKFENPIIFDGGTGKGFIIWNILIWPGISDDWSQGEKAIFFIDSDGSKQQAWAHSGKFPINDGIVYNEFHSNVLNVFEPTPLEILKQNISKTVKMQNKVENFLNSNEGQHVLTKLEKEYTEQSMIPIKEKTLKKIAYREIKELFEQNITRINPENFKVMVTPYENFKGQNVDIKYSSKT